MGSAGQVQQKTMYSKKTAPITAGPRHHVLSLSRANILEEPLTQLRAPQGLSARYALTPCPPRQPLNPRVQASGGASLLSLALGLPRRQHSFQAGVAVVEARLARQPATLRLQSRRR